MSKLATPRTSSFAFAVPKAKPFQEVSEIFPNELADILRSASAAGPSSTDRSPTPSLLLLDLRPFAQFSESRIESSLNICVPTMMLKRPNVTPDKIFESLSSDYAKKAVTNWRSSKHIVLYDNDSNISMEQNPIVLLARKLAREKNASQKISYLKGGFPAMSSSCPDRLDSSPSPLGSGGIDAPAAALLGLPNLRATHSPAGRGMGGMMMHLSLPPIGPFTAPSVLYDSNPLAAPLPSSQLVAMETDPPVSSCRPSTPAYLRDGPIGEAPEGFATEKFAVISEEEKARVQKSFVAKGPTDAFSVSEGLEGGTKNRFNYIWPCKYYSLQFL